MAYTPQAFVRYANPDPTEIQAARFTDPDSKQNVSYYVYSINGEHEGAAVLFNGTIVPLKVELLPGHDHRTPDYRVTFNGISSKVNFVIPSLTLPNGKQVYGKTIDPRSIDGDIKTRLARVLTGKAGKVLARGHQPLQIAAC